MKRVYLLGFFIMAICMQGFAQGIQFSKMSYEEALATAKAQKKGIFVDIYTTWCGPCKQMDKEVFPRKDVGDYYNARFVSLKLDAEKEADHGLFKKFKAQGYPTYYWITSEGELLNVEVGSRSPEAFIQLADKAANSNLEAKRKAYAARWDKGERSMELVTDYVYGILSRINPEAVKPHVLAYLSTLSKEQLRTPAISNIVAGYMGRDWQGEMFNYIVDYADAHEKNIGYLPFRVMMYRMLIRSSNALVANGKTAEAQQHIAFMKSANIPDKAMYLKILDAEYLLQSGKYNEGLKGIVSVTEEFGKANPYLYEEFCYSFISSGALMKAKFKSKETAQLIHIASVAFELARNQKTVVFLAAMHAKAGDYKKAYQVASAVQFNEKPLLPGILFEKDLGIRPVIATEFGITADKKEMAAFLEQKAGPRKATR